MNKIIFLIILGVMSFESKAKELEYGFIGGVWMCKESVQTGKNRFDYFYKPCNSNNLWDIYNRDDQKWIKDGNFHKNKYDKFKPSKNVNDNCGLKYNPKNGITYKYPKCVKTFNYS